MDLPLSPLTPALSCIPLQPLPSLYCSPNFSPMHLAGFFFGSPEDRQKPSSRLYGAVRSFSRLRVSNCPGTHLPEDRPYPHRFMALSPAR